MSLSAHVDRFALERLPPRELWPEFRFDTPELQYPERVNCARVLLDDAVAEGHGERIALQGEQSAVTYAQLQAESDAVAGVLVRELGLIPGNRVLLRGTNGPRLAALWLGTIKAGGIAVTTMPMLRAPELAAILQKAKVQFALCDQALSGELNEAVAKAGTGTHVVTWCGGELEAMLQRQAVPFQAVDTARDDVCMLAFTSGTTGPPKATMHFHRDVLAMADVVGRHLLGTQPHDRYLGSPPLGFTFGLGALLVFPLRFRASAILLGAPRPRLLLEAVQRWRVTCLFTAPTMYRALASLVPEYDISSLRQCVSAGEPLPRATFDLWQHATGIRLTDGIGATEMTHIFIGASGNDIRPGATGRPLPGYVACVLDENDQPLPRGGTGRLAVKGPTGCRYLDDERQRDYVADGWNVTGDIYRQDEDGYYWFVGRADDMVISAGYSIGPAEVEAALLQHPAVAECAVVGSPDPARGQIVKAFVVLRDDHDASTALLVELQNFVKATIAPYKYPRAVEFLPALPKSQTGKVQRYVLRQRELEAARNDGAGNGAGGEGAPSQGCH